MNIEIFTDGSATVSTKPGGYGWVIVIDGKGHSEGAGPIENATNNDAELEAAIQGLAATLKLINTLPKEDHDVTLVSDSEIILGWADGSYRFKQQKKIKKFEQLQWLVKRMNVKTRWVEGHSGNIYNERCDEIANYARKSLIPNSPKKRTAKWKDACKKMYDALLYLKQELTILEQEHNFPRHDMMDKVDEAIEMYEVNK